MKKTLIVVLLFVMIIPFAFAKKADNFDNFYVLAEFSFDSFEKFSFENVQAGVFFHPLFNDNATNAKAKNVKLILAYSYSTTDNSVFNGPRLGVSYRVNNAKNENLFDLNTKILFSNNFYNFHVSGFDFSIQKSNVAIDNLHPNFSDEDFRAMSDSEFKTNASENEYKNVFYANIGYFLSFDLNPLKSGLHFNGKFKFTENAFIKSSFITHFSKDGIFLDDYVFSAKYKFNANKFTGTANMAVNYSYDNPNYANGLTVGFEGIYTFATIKIEEMKDEVLADILEQTTVKLNIALEAGVYGNFEDFKFNFNLASLGYSTSMNLSKTIDRIKAKNFGGPSTSLGFAYYNNLLNSQDEKGLFLTYSFEPGITIEDDVYRVNYAWNLKNYKINKFFADGKVGIASEGASGLIFGN